MIAFASRSARVVAIASLLAMVASPVLAQQRPAQPAAPAPQRPAQAAPAGPAAPQISASALALAKEIMALKGTTNMFDPLVVGVVEQTKNVLMQTNFNVGKDLNEVALDL